MLIAGNGDSIFKRLMAAIGRDDLGSDPALADNAGRVARVDEIDAAIGAWTATRTRRRGAGRAGRGARCRPAASTPWPTSPPTRTTGARHDAEQVRTRRRQRARRAGHRAQAVGARPAAHRRARRALGEDTDAVLREIGLSTEQIEALKERGIVSGS